MGTVLTNVSTQNMWDIIFHLECWNAFTGELYLKNNLFYNKVHLEWHNLLWLKVLAINNFIIWSWKTLPSPETCILGKGSLASLLVWGFQNETSVRICAFIKLALKSAETLVSSGKKIKQFLFEMTLINTEWNEKIRVVDFHFSLSGSKALNREK